MFDRTGKNEKKGEKQYRKMTKNVRDYLVSGENVYEDQVTLQALEPCSSRTEARIRALYRILEDFEQDGGTIDRIDAENGYSAVYLFDTIELHCNFAKSGKLAGIPLSLYSSDEGSNDLDPEDFMRAYNAMHAMDLIPRLEEALTHLGEVVDIIENSNALEGLQMIKNVLGADKDILFEAATAEEEEDDNPSDDQIPEMAL